MIKHSIGFVACTLLLAACSAEQNEETSGRTAAEDAAAVAAVEAAQTLPPVPLNLSPIAFPDIERENLFGAGCSFAPDGGGMGALAIAQAEQGYLKMDGEIVLFAPDAGSAELPYGGREQYTSTEHSFRLALIDAEGQRSGYETTDYRGRLTIRDSSDRVAYQADGLVQCGA